MSRIFAGSQGMTNTREKCNRTSCCSHSRLLRRQQSSNSRLALSEHPQETWHKKREALEEERIVGDQDEKTKYSYDEVLTTATACFSYSLMHLTKELTPHFANLLRSSEDSWTSWKNARQCKPFKSCGYTTSKL